MPVGLKWTEQFNFRRGENVASDVLFEALTSGQVSERDYFPWAQEKFELALVGEDFFSVPADLTFWDRVKDVHPWTAHLFPLAEWQGVLFIACVEPPPIPLRLQQPYRFVLAPASNMKTYWRNFAPTPATDLPDGVLGAFMTNVDLTPKLPPPPSQDEPEGLRVNTEKIAALPEEPDGFAAALPQPAPLPPPPPSQVESVDPSWVVPIEPIPIEHCLTMDDLTRNALSFMLRHFTGAALLLDEGQRLRISKFTAPFRQPQSEFGPLDLTTPNIFRIVHRTHLPYCGATAPSAENDRFFGAYLGGLAPAHVTIVPIMIDKTCAGMLMGIADTERSFRHILPIMDLLARKFGTAYARVHTGKIPVAA